MPRRLVVTTAERPGNLLMITSDTAVFADHGAALKCHTDRLVKHLSQRRVMQRFPWEAADTTLLHACAAGDAHCGIYAL